MMNQTMVNRIFFLLILSLYFVPICRAAISLFPKLHVYVGNGLPNDTNLLTVHCQSQDDDVGCHTLAVGEEIQWSFHQNLIQSTLYFCQFWWAGKDKSIVVFDKSLHERLCGKVCPWLVKEDGFYLSMVGGYLRLHTW